MTERKVIELALERARKELLEVLEKIGNDVPDNADHESLTLDELRAKFAAEGRDLEKEAREFFEKLFKDKQ